MADKFNKGFKGIDKQDGFPFSTSNSWTKGRQHVQDRFFQRKVGQQQAYIDGETSYEITEWRSTAWSSSYEVGSGSLMYWTPSTNTALGWPGNACMSVASIRLREWSGPHLTSSVQFKAGNCRGGSTAGNAYGFFGLVNRGLIGRTYGGAIDNPYSDYSTLPQWGYTAFTATANAWPVYEQQATSKGTLTGVNCGDTMAIQVTKDGVVSYKYAKTSLNPTSSLVDFQTFATSGTNIVDSKSNCKDYHVILANNAAGAEGNFHSYDWKFQGEVNFQPYWFDKQFDQEMIDIPTSVWQSGSSFNIDSVRPFENAQLGGTSLRIDPAASTAYTDWAAADYWITGSGEGGIYTFQMAQDIGLFPVALMCSIVNYDKVSGFNHQTQTVQIRPDVRTTNWDDYPGISHSLPAWYGQGSGAQVVMITTQPITSGSQVAIIVTGSDWGFLSETGSGVTPVITPDNGQVAALLWKPNTTTGIPANKWISPHWHLWAYAFKGSAAGAMPAQKLTFNNGNDGAQVDMVKVGNYILSGSAESP